MAINYVKLQATALRLINENGRAITLVRKSRTPADANEPWNGPTGADTTLSLTGVFVPPSSVREFGLPALGEGTEYQDMLRFSQQIVIVAPEANDVRNYEILQDRSDDWGIVATQVLRPGDLTMLAFIGVRR
jgi:hypothetical protein